MSGVMTFILVKKKREKSKAQSAMEYFMTYGWAILIIAVILAALSEFGVFNGSGSTASTCIALPGYVCANPIYSTNGISFTLSQNTGQYYYDANVFVAAEGSDINQKGLPLNFTPSNSYSIGTLVPGQTSAVNFAGTKYTTAGGIPIDAPIGTPFHGYVWLGYCTSQPCSQPTNFAKVAIISTKVSSEPQYDSCSSDCNPAPSTSVTTTPTTTLATTSAPTTTIPPIGEVAGPLNFQVPVGHSETLHQWTIIDGGDTPLNFMIDVPGSLQVTSSANSSEGQTIPTVTAFPLNGTIQPHGMFVVNVTVYMPLNNTPGQTSWEGLISAVEVTNQSNSGGAFGAVILQGVAKVLSITSTK